MTYDPRRLRGVSVYREAERSFAEGDRVQYTAPSKDLHISNRELGTMCVSMNTAILLYTPIQEGWWNPT